MGLTKKQLIGQNKILTEDIITLIENKEFMKVMDVKMKYSQLLELNAIVHKSRSIGITELSNLDGIYSQIKFVKK